MIIEEDHSTAGARTSASPSFKNVRLAPIWIAIECFSRQTFEVIQKGGRPRPTRGTSPVRLQGVQYFGHRDILACDQLQQRFPIWAFPRPSRYHGRMQSQ